MIILDNQTLEKTTVYLHLSHQLILDELKMKLRRHGLKPEKSRLIRLAVDWLNEQDLKTIIQRLQPKPGT